MGQSKDILIKKFFDNLCAETEAEEAISIIEKNPQIIEEYLSDNEIDVLQKLHWQLPDSITARLHEKIFDNIRIHKRKQVNTFIRSMAAACILGILIISFFPFDFSKQKSATSVGFTKLGYVQLNNTLPDEKLLITENKTNNILKTILPDGSTVLLKPKAIIQYPAYFTTNRKIHLDGDAYFIVKKDKQHPFIVTEGEVGVKALGTEFWVCNQANKDIITVSLKKGKVLIQSMSSAFSFDKVILAPNQDFVINKAKGTTALLNNSINNTNTTTHNSIYLEKSTVNIDEKAIYFSCTPIKDVFKIIESYFNIVIISPKTTHSKNQFTGKIYLRDSIDAIIEKISLMNDFEYDFHKAHNGGKDSLFIYPTQKNNALQKIIENKMDDKRPLIQAADKKLVSTNYLKSATHAPLTKQSILINQEYIDFKQTPIAQVFNSIEEYYQIKVNVKNHVQNKNTFTGKVYHKESAIDFLKKVCTINNLKATYDSRTQTIIIQ